MGADPMLVNAAQAARPGRGWWRNLLDMYGASDILVAEVQLQRLYPGGPARARFIARHGPDNEIVGGFTLTAPNSDGIAAMMAQGTCTVAEYHRMAAEKVTAVQMSTTAFMLGRGPAAVLAPFVNRARANARRLRDKS